MHVVNWDDLRLEVERSSEYKDYWEKSLVGKDLSLLRSASQVIVFLRPGLKPIFWKALLLSQNYTLYRNCIESEFGACWTPDGIIDYEKLVDVFPRRIHVLNPFQGIIFQ